MTISVIIHANKEGLTTGLLIPFSGIEAVFVKKVFGCSYKKKEQKKKTVHKILSLKVIHSKPKNLAKLNQQEPGLASAFFVPLMMIILNNKKSIFIQSYRHYKYS